MGTLIPLKVIAPGFLGLNTRLSVTGELQWAGEALNCVIDDRGRIAARQGRTNVTTAQISLNPNVKAIFEQIDNDGTLNIISAAGNAFYTGTTTLTARTGSITGTTDDHWQFQNIAGRLVGFQGSHEPVTRTTGNFTPLQAELTDWAATTNYAVGDLVKALSSANPTLYFHATADAGSSGGSEPTWPTTVGATVVDSGITWTTRRIPNGNICHSAFGRIWVTAAGDDSAIEFSDTLLPAQFRGGAAGTLDLKTVWGGDRVTAIASTEDFLVIFGRRHVLVFDGPEDPATMVLLEKIVGIGCIARDSIQNTGKDLLFLSDSGVRSLGRVIQGGGKQPLGDLSFNVRDEMLEDMRTGSEANIKSVYHEAEGFYIIGQTGLATPREWVFDLRFPNPDGTAKVTRWRGFDAKAFFSSQDRTLYVGHLGRLSQYANFNDGPSGTYDMLYSSTWVDFTSVPLPFSVVGRFKIPKRWITTFISLKAYTVKYIWGFDYRGAQHTTTSALIRTVDSGAEWGNAEWNLAEWSGGDVFEEGRIGPNGHGEIMKIGFSLTVDAFSISTQSIDLAVKLGRLR